MFLTKIPTFEATEISKKYFLPRGALMDRLFSDGRYAFVQVLGAQPDYGWVYINPARQGVSWAKYQAAASTSAGITLEVFQLIEKELGEANRIYERLYTHFNRQTAGNLPAPQWTATWTEKAVVCRLENAPPFMRQTESSRYILNHIERAIQPFRLRALLQDNTITVSPRKGR